MTKAALFRITAALVLALLLGVVLVDVVRRPERHTTTPTYQRASVQWWAGEDVYNRDEHGGFLYLPSAAIIYTPFAFIPKVGFIDLGGLAWRSSVLLLFVFALGRLAHLNQRVGRPSKVHPFWPIVLLSLPSALASLRNAQFDLPLAAALVLATVALAEARLVLVAFWLCFGLALKPLAIVPILLFGALWPGVMPRLFAGLAITFSLTFLHWKWGYVWHEYHRCGATLLWATRANEPRYSDFAALLARLGLPFPYTPMVALRVVAALGTCALGYLVWRRLERWRAAWLLGALAATYLMLFNPRTETCSYVMLGPFLASYARLGWPFARGSSLIAGAAALALACDALPVLHGWTDRWLKPLVALGCVPLWLHLARGNRFWPQASSLEIAASTRQVVLPVR